MTIMVSPLMVGGDRDESADGDCNDRDESADHVCDDNRDEYADGG